MTMGFDGDRMPVAEMQNGVLGSDFTKLLDLATHTAISISKSHCGPRSQFSVQMNPLNSSSYTRDGINILRSFRATDANVQALLNEFSFVGDSVEREVGDGTTTAIFFCACLTRVLSAFTNPVHTDRSSILYMLADLGTLMAANHVPEEMQNAIDRALRTANYRQLETAWRLNCRDIEQYMNHYTISLARLISEMGMSRQEAITTIARLQSQCSSHYDEKLTTAVIELFSNLPEDAWPHIDVRTSRIETEERFWLDRGIADMEDVPEGATTCFNVDVRPVIKPTGEESRDLFYGDDTAHVVVISTVLPALDSPDGQALQETVNRLLESYPDEKVVVITPSPVDQNAHRMLVQFVVEKNPQVSLYYHDLGQFQANYNDLVTLGVLHGTYDRTRPSAPFYLGRQRVREVQHSLHFFDVYTDESDSLEIPKSDDPLHPRGLWAAALLSRITELQRQSHTIDPERAQEAIRYFRALYLKARYKNIPQLILGGAIHDITEQVDVITDAIKAVRSALVHGCHPGLNKSLWGATASALNGYQAAVGGETTFKPSLIRLGLFYVLLHIQTTFGRVLLNGMDSQPDDQVEIDHAGAHTETLLAMGTVLDSGLAMPNATVFDVPFVYADYDFEEVKTTTLRTVLDQGLQVPLQSARLATTLLNRIGEVGLRLACTCDGVNVAS